MDLACALRGENIVWRWSPTSVNASSTLELCTSEMVKVESQAAAQLQIVLWMGKVKITVTLGGEESGEIGESKVAACGELGFIRVHSAVLFIRYIFEHFRNYFKVLVCHLVKKTTCLFHDKWVLQEREVGWSGMELLCSQCRRLRGE